jgi:hypothetical protein
MSAFKRVIMAVGQPEIAKVNTKTGTLYLSDAIWKGLPAAEKSFVLFHEEGHLKLQTSDEYAANAYAVGKFLPAGTFTNKQLGQKIMVMRSILDKADGKTETANFGIAEAVSGAVTATMENLSVLGIGSKSRLKETAAAAAANKAVIDAQSTASNKKSKSTMTIVLIGGVLVIVAIAIYFTLRK